MWQFVLTKASTDVCFDRQNRAHLDKDKFPTISLCLCASVVKTNDLPPNLHCKKKKVLTNQSGRIGPSKSQITKSDEQVLIPEYFGHNSRIFKDHPCKCLIPKDRGGRGTVRTGKPRTKKS
jgi:hypothetical protein